MNRFVRLDGLLVCKDEHEAERVRRHLAEHVRLTQAEPGCVSFEVLPAGEAGVWSVSECFVDGDAFRTHQGRVAASEWSRATAGIERRYVVTGLDEE